MHDGRYEVSDTCCRHGLQLPPCIHFGNLLTNKELALCLLLSAVGAFGALYAASYFIGA